jgi:integrase/recombinase XerD
MRVTKELDPASNALSFTLIGATGVMEPAERYLRYLAETERSPNTIKAHAHDMKDWFVFPDEYGRDWQSVKLEDLGAFIRWLRRPPDMRGQVFSVLPAIGHHCGEATVNRKLSIVSVFYQHAARHGLNLGDLITCWDPSARQAGWKPFLHHVSKGAAKQRRVVKLPVTSRIPRLYSSRWLLRLRRRLVLRCSHYIPHASPRCALGGFSLSRARRSTDAPTTAAARLAQLRQAADGA